jgi:hypothetical protein
VKPEEAPREELDPEEASGAHVPEGREISAVNGLGKSSEGISPVRRCLGQKDRPETYELEDGSFKERSEISVASHASHERKLAFLGKLRELATRYMFSFGQEYRPAVNRVGYSSTREDFVEREYLFTKEEVKAEDADMDGKRQAMEKPTKVKAVTWKTQGTTKAMSTRTVKTVKAIPRVTPTQSKWRIWDPGRGEAHVVLRGVIVRIKHDPTPAGCRVLRPYTYRIRVSG